MLLGQEGRWMRGHARALLALVGTLALLVGAVPTALADPDPTPPAYPSQSDVDQARDKVTHKATAVAQIKAELALADQRLGQAADRAEQASEAYNGARWKLQQAREAARKAVLDSARARAEVTSQRDSIAALVTSTYISGGNLQSLDALISTDGPRAVMDRALAYEGASSQMDATLERFRAASSLADVFEQAAQDARLDQLAAAQDARDARDAAVSAAAAAQAQSDQLAAHKATLVAQLAAAQGISVKLAQQRQDALAEIARQQARAEARRKAEEARLAEAAREAKAAQQARDAETAHNDGPSSTPDAPEAPAPPAPSKGAGAAIAFAKAQLGEPYRWGAAGPSSWDCSGLMMGAWGAAGVSLPHYSAAQYSAGTPIGVGQLRPGDLVFWGSSPASIHHVAMYLGNGLIIHAPRTGKPVEIDSMYYWVPPNYFARVS